jgi:hypothetical protein
VKITFAELQRGLEDGRLLSARHTASVDDSHLDQRDRSHFADAWMASHSRVESAAVRLSPVLRHAVDQIRELAYRHTFNWTQNPDIAGYVSDDFGLIAGAVAAGVEDTWVEGLLDSYAAGRVPGGV